MSGPLTHGTQGQSYVPPKLGYSVVRITAKQGKLSSVKDKFRMPC